MKKRGGYLSIVLMVLFCSSCRDLFPVQVRQGNFREVLDVMRLDGKKVLILLASKDCSVCEATKDDWAGDKMLVEKLNRNPKNTTCKEVHSNEEAHSVPVPTIVTQTIILRLQ